MPRIALIGAGQMAKQIGTRLVRFAGVPREEIVASHYRPEQAARFHRATGIPVLTDNSEATANSDIVVLCVRPQQARQVLAPLRPFLADGQRTLISIAVGPRVATLAKWVRSTGVIHLHPTSLLMATEHHNPGVSLWVAHPDIDPTTEKRMRRLFAAALGDLWTVPETQLPKYIFITGNCPAFLLRALEAFVAAARLPAHRAIGLEATILKSLHAGVGIEGRSPGQIIRRIATPGGVTEAGLKVLEGKCQIELQAREVYRACKQRLRELSRAV